MGKEKMPISLLRNAKTVDYLKGMFGIQAGELKIFDDPLENKLVAWIFRIESKRLDLTEKESEQLENWSHAAYSRLKNTETLNNSERIFLEQHEFFFFKN